jgi:hypothetical protein
MASASSTQSTETILQFDEFIKIFSQTSTSTLTLTKHSEFELNISVKGSYGHNTYNLRLYRGEFHESNMVYLDCSISKDVTIPIAQGNMAGAFLANVTLTLENFNPQITNLLSGIDSDVDELFTIKFNEEASRFLGIDRDNKIVQKTHSTTSLNSIANKVYKIIHNPNSFSNAVSNTVSNNNRNHHNVNTTRNEMPISFAQQLPEPRDIIPTDIIPTAPPAPPGTVLIYPSPPAPLLPSAPPAPAEQAPSYNVSQARNRPPSYNNTTRLIAPPTPSYNNIPSLIASAPPAPTHDLSHQTRQQGNTRQAIMSGGGRRKKYTKTKRSMKKKLSKKRK